jgi:hypothetical protein
MPAMFDNKICNYSFKIRCAAASNSSTMTPFEAQSFNLPTKIIIA